MNPDIRAIASANWRPSGNKLEDIFPEGMVVELLGDDGNPIMSNGKSLKARVIATPWSHNGEEPEKIFLNSRFKTASGYQKTPSFTRTPTQIQPYKYIAPCEP